MLEKYSERNRKWEGGREEKEIGERGEDKRMTEKGYYRGKQRERSREGVREKRIIAILL